MVLALNSLKRVDMPLKKETKPNHHHHHHIVLAARISLTLSRHSSLSFIALGMSSGQQPVSSHSCWMYVRAGRPAFARPCVGIHKSTSLMSSSVLLQQCPACLVRLTWIAFVIGGALKLKPNQSHHNTKIKREIYIGFTQEFLGFAPSKFLNDAFDCIDYPFLPLQYPKGVSS